MRLGDLMTWVYLLPFFVVLGYSVIRGWINRRKLEGYIYSSSISYFLLGFGGLYLIFSLVEYLDHSNVNIALIIIGITLIYKSFFEILMIGENGICKDGVFFSWEEIECFHWDVDDGNKLIINVNKRKFLLVGRKKLYYKVFTKEKYEIDQLLKKYVVKGY